MGSVAEPAQPEIWLDEPRVARGSVDKKSVRVKLKRWETEGVSPIVAALGELPNAIDLTVLKRADGGVELVPESFRDTRFGGAKESFFEIARQAPGGLGLVPAVAEATEYATGLIKQHRPDFDSYTPEQRAEFLLDTIKQVNKVVKSLEGLHKHLEHAEPGRKAVAERKDPGRDVRAAILKDVCGWSTLRIGKEWSISAPKSDANKGENQTVRGMIKRGRSLLEQCFGAQEWHTKADRMHAEYERWKSMGPRQQFYALVAEKRGTSPKQEERGAIEDGFDKTLDEWISAWEQGDYIEMQRIQLSDDRFGALNRL